MIFGELNRYIRDKGPIKNSRSIKENAAKVSAAREKFERSEAREPTVSELARASGLSCEDVTMALDAMRPVLSFSAPMGEEGELSLEGLICEDESCDICDILT
ncbi:MAG: sigma-70 domain-containing protein, partial [Oscillospiraceae bacterium]